MPQVARFRGISVEMYYRDHPPPHFHAYYADESAIIDIETMEIRRGQPPNINLFCGSPGMTDALRTVVEVRPLDGYRVFLRFDDGLQGEIDLEPLLTPFDGVFAPLRDPARFREVFVDCHTVSWPNGADLAPEVLYSRVSGRPLITS